MQPNMPDHDAETGSVKPDDFAREVYGVMGIPIDAVDMASVLRRIGSAAITRQPFLISTANLNFLVNSRADAEFRESLLLSDLCTADGMPIIWIARLLGVPLKERIAGADIFDALKSWHYATRRLKAFLFGGAEGVAAAVCKKLNDEDGTLICAGSHDPGFCSVEAMSTGAIIDEINSSNADFLAAALGAKKGQAWLLRNHDRLLVPVRVHLGATLNFQAGLIKRAPAWLQSSGLEWLWRIKEEPQLWRRYRNDGLALLELILTRIVPILLDCGWNRLRGGQNNQNLTIEQADEHDSVTLSVNGNAIGRHVDGAAASFRNAAAAGKDVRINFTNTRQMDARFLGLLLMLNKHLKKRGLQLGITRPPPRIARIFRQNGFEFLLDS